tara:strand:- start:1785 stop:3269 length:1485 start_codon:yes stop_codon:yes gene_type:complete
MARYKIYNQQVYITNNTPTKTIFDQRQKFERLYPKGFGFPEPIDFWQEKNRMYGFMDQNKNLIHPDPAFIKQLKGSNNGNLFAFDFVCDAFNGMQHYFNGKNTQKMIEDGERVKKPLKAHKAWDDPLEIRKSLDHSIYRSFVRIFLKGQNKHKLITNLEDFIEVFFNLCMKDIIPDTPLTLSGLMLTNLISPMSNGLCIEVSLDDHSNVHKFYDTYYNNKNYKTYLMIAAKYGFMVDKNVPFRLVANLGSPKMLNFMRARMEDYLSIPRTGQTNFSVKDFVVKPGDTPLDRHTHEYELDEDGNGETSIYTDSYGTQHKHQVTNFIITENQGWKKMPSYPYPVGIGYHNHTENYKKEPFPKSQNPVDLSLDKYFERYYISNTLKDIALLRSKVLGMYNKYVNEFPNSSYSVPCGPIRSQKVTVNRINISYQNMLKEGFNTLFYTKLYFLVRLKELKADVTDESIKVNIKKIDTLWKLVDKYEAIRYIDVYLKQFY